MRIDPATGLRPARQPVLRRHLPAVQPLQGVRRWGCGTRSGSPSTPSPTSPTSATSAGTPGRRSTPARAPTSAGRATRAAPPAPAPVESGTTTSLQQGSYAGSAGTLRRLQRALRAGLGAVRAPIFSYSHDGIDGAGGTGGASANGGTFYTGTVYPPQYQNALFILDYNRRWIRYLTFDAQGRATVHNFGIETANGMVQVLPRARHQPLRRRALGRRQPGASHPLRRRRQHATHGRRRRARPRSAPRRSR